MRALRSASCAAPTMPWRSSSSASLTGTRRAFTAGCSARRTSSWRRSRMPEGPASGMDRPLAVLVLTPWYPTADFPHRGVFVVEQVRALAGAGAKVSVIHADTRPFGFQRTIVRQPRTEHGAVVYSATGRAFLPRLEAAYAGAASRLTDRLLRDLDRDHGAGGPPDILHAHVSYPIGAIAVELGRRWQRPVVITEHFGPFSQLIARPLARRRALWALAEADAVVAVSSAQARDLARAGVARAVEVIPNVVDPVQFAPQPLPPPVPFKVIAVGALVAGKDPAAILDAAARLVAARPDLDLHVTLVGSGPLRPALEQQATALGLRGRVVFAGDLPRGRLAEELAGHHLFALASRGETFSVAVAEALA